MILYIHLLQRMMNMIELKTKTFWRATIALGIASFFIFANVYFTQPLLPVFSEEFAISPVVSSLSVSLVLLTLGCSFFMYSGISDRYGRKNVMIAVMVIASAVSFLIPLSTSFEMLLGLRILQAVALAGIPTIAMSYIGEEFAMKALTLAIGIHISANTIGGMGGRVIGGVMTDWFSWQVAFIVMGVVSILCLLFFILLLPPSNHFQKRPFNLKEVSTEYKEHLKNRTLRLAYYVGGLHFFVFIGLFSFITFYLSAPPFLVSTTVLGFLFLTYIAGTVSSTLAGKASQLMKQSTCIGVGIGIMVLAMLLTLIPSIIAITIGLLFLCFGFFFAHSSSSAWVTKNATQAKGSAASLYLTSYYFGGSLGSVYLGFFWNLAGWQGVIVGALIILLFTTYCTVSMFKIEQRQNRQEKRNWQEASGT